MESFSRLKRLSGGRNWKSGCKKGLNFCRSRVFSQSYMGSLCHAGGKEQEKSQKAPMGWKFGGTHQRESENACKRVFRQKENGYQNAFNLFNFWPGVGPAPSFGTEGKKLIYGGLSRTLFGKTERWNHMLPT